MIVLDRPTLQRLIDGDLIQIDDPDLRYEKGHVYDVGTNDRATMCRAWIVGVDRNTVQIKLAYQQRVTMLRKGAKAGYTDRPDLAMDISEPEAFGPEEVEQMANDARDRWRHYKKVEREGMPLAQRVEELEQRAADGDDQAKRHLHVIRQRVESAEEREARNLEQAKHPKRAA